MNTGMVSYKAVWQMHTRQVERTEGCPENGLFKGLVINLILLSTASPTPTVSSPHFSHFPLRLLLSQSVWLRTSSPKEGRWDKSQFLQPFQGSLNPSQAVSPSSSVPGHLGRTSSPVSTLVLQDVANTAHQ